MGSSFDEAIFDKANCCIATAAAWRSGDADQQNKYHLQTNIHKSVDEAKIR